MIQESLRRATVEIVILQLLTSEDLYVYDMVQRIADISGGLYTVPEATVYPVMYRLTAKGLIEDFDRMVNKRMRKYYHITPAGQEYFNNILNEFNQNMAGLKLIFEGGESRC